MNPLPPHDPCKRRRRVRACAGRAAAALCAAAVFLVAGCGETARLTVAAGTGPEPTLPPPAKTLLPTIKIAEATGWPPGGAPLAMPGAAVNAYATALDHPRWLYVLPNGDVLVAEADAPPKPEGLPSAGGVMPWIKEWVMKRAMRRAGAGRPSANRITLLRDADGDGVAELRSAFLEGLNSPFGMALVGGDLYVANTDALMRYAYTPGATRIDAPPTRVVELPSKPRNHHWTKNVVASRDGAKLYVTVGSNSNIAEHGLEVEAGRAAIWEVDRASGAHRVYATGLRNPNGLAWEPATGALWTVVNERDELGSDLVPDYLTRVVEGGWYGWPYSYWGARVDDRVQPQRPDLVARVLVPDYALGPHTAPLGLAWSGGVALAGMGSGMFVGLHGSWNRKPPSGYKVIWVPFANGRPAGPPVDVLTGFLGTDGKALGRPVGVAVDARGALLVADDVGNAVWRVVPAR